MKDIGYYAGFLSEKDQDTINKSSIDELTSGLFDLASDLDISHGETMVFLHVTKPTSDRDKIALIRGLCDRIEVKLMEEAK